MRARPPSPRPLRRTSTLGATLGLAVLLAGCADVPVPSPAAPGTATGPAPVVAVDQAAQVRAEVAGRLLAARVAGDPVLVEAAATGPAAALERLRVQVDGAQPDAVALAPAQASVLVAPQVDGWPRWFATVTDPALAPAPDRTAVPDAEPPAPSAGAAAATDSAEPSEPATDGPVDGEGGGEGELPVIELYDSDDVRTPYRLWARMTMLPGAELPAFADPLLGAGSLADGPAPAPAASDEPSVEASADVSGEPPVGEADAGLLAVLQGLASRYAAVMTDGDASAGAAEFEPDPFVDAIRARTAAERAAVSDVAGFTVSHEPSEGVEVLYAARTAAGDVLAVTAVTTTTTIAVREGAGTLSPGAEVRGAAGIQETDGTLTTRSVAALAFVVPAEQGAIRLVAVGEGLVGAEAP